MARMYGLARIGADVVLRYAPNGGAVANVLLAFSWGKRGDDGTKKTQWVEATLWGKKAESLTPFLKKGRQIVAHLDEVFAETYTKKDGVTLSKMSGTLTDVEFIAEHQAQKQETESGKRTDPEAFDIPF